MSFRVGQRVVCVNAGDQEGRRDGNFVTPSSKNAGVKLVKGAIYTIRELMNGQGGAPGVRLEEFVLPIHPVFGCECGWWADRFRALAFKPQSAEHDISLFNDILDKAMERA